MIGNKYGCGCGSQPKPFYDPCCGGPQRPPSPCCEAHFTQFVGTPCLFNVCDVTASKDGFFLTFTDPSTAFIPVNSSQLFFWAAPVGLMRVLSYNGTSFNVTLVDPQKDGVGISKTDCIMAWLQPSNTVGSNTIQRCLTGQFLAPAMNASQLMYIVNGTAIPIGATLTITWHGQVGSYVVTAYVGASGNVYAYTVENTGSGLTPGTFVDGGEANAGCAVPVEVISTVDICQTSQTTTLDSVAGCLNGSPRSLKATAPNQTIVSGDGNIFGLRTLSDVNCCLTTMGCLKFTLSEGCGDTDTTTVADVGIDCMSDAWDLATAYGDDVPATIEGFPFLITNWNPETKAITLMPVGIGAFDGEEILELESGTQICLGGCCNVCTNGPETTSENVIDEENSLLNANFAFAEPVNLAYDHTTPKYYLVGIKTDGTNGILELDATYHLTGDPLPKHADPLLIRQKICNDSRKGCNQKVKLDYNWSISVDGLPEDYRMHAEVGSFIAESATLADGTTPNPNRYASSQAKSTDDVTGPTLNDTTVTAETGLGFGGSDQPKNYPHLAGTLTDWSLCKVCDCINAVLWLFIIIDPLPGAASSGNVTIQPSWRRIMTKFDTNTIPNPENLPTLEGWAGGSE